jgi:hypothetical protein
LGRGLPTPPQGVLIEPCRTLAKEPLRFRQDGEFRLLRIKESLTQKYRHAEHIASVAFPL